MSKGAKAQRKLKEQHEKGCLTRKERDSCRR